MVLQLLLKFVLINTSLFTPSGNTAHKDANKVAKKCLHRASLRHKKLFFAARFNFTRWDAPLVQILFCCDSTLSTFAGLADHLGSTA